MQYLALVPAVFSREVKRLRYSKGFVIKEENCYEFFQKLHH